MVTGITNAVAEGINSVVQMAKSRARGFRNIENFKAMIYFLGNDFKFNFHCLWRRTLVIKTIKNQLFIN